MIKIISTRIVDGLEEGEPQTRHCEIIITDNGNRYRLGVGGLPFTGDLQVILDAEHDELLVVAKQKGDIKTTKEVRRLLYNAAWSSDDFQEAIIEHLAGDSTRLDAIVVKRDAIRSEWT